MASPTDTEMLDSFRNALMAISTGQQYTINGRTLTRADIAQVRETIEWLEQRIADAAQDDGTGTGGIVLARFN